MFELRGKSQSGGERTEEKKKKEKQKGGGEGRVREKHREGERKIENKKLK